MDNKKSPIDFSKITQKDVEKADSYKQLKNYELIDFLEALAKNNEKKKNKKE